jgi:triacylglycerol lipase
MTNLNLHVILGLLSIQLVTATSLFAQAPAPAPAPAPDAAKQGGPPVSPAAVAMEKYTGMLLEKAPYKGIDIARDVKYGSADRNQVDIFTPVPASSTPRPVLLFVHGGGFISGSKQYPNDSPFYDNVGVWAVRHGFIGALTTYRLAPQFPWPAGPEDVGATIRYLKANIASKGGDPNRIYLIAHSAGAVHSAAYLTHPEFQGSLGGPGVAGAILVSGGYDVVSMIKSAGTAEREKAYYGEDASKYEGQSSMAGLVSTKLPLLVAYAERDLPLFRAQATELRAALDQANNKSVKMIELPGYTHFGTIFSINTTETGLTDVIEAFVKENAKPGL